MKTYLINTFKKATTAGQHLDFISTIKSQEWVVFNDDKTYVEKFLFVDDSKLLVSVNGKSSYSKWEYIKINSSLVIDDEKNRYLLNIVICNTDIIVLNIDSTDCYSFLINSKSSFSKDATYEDIQWYLIRQCGIDILTDEQRDKLAEEKRLEAERKKKEEEKRENEQRKLVKNILIYGSIVLLIIIGVSSLQEYSEYKKYHPTIYTTKEENKTAIDLGLSVKWATCNIGANSPEEYGNYYGWGDVTGQNVTRGTDNAYVIDYEFPPRKTTDLLPSSITNGPFDMAKANWGNNWRLPTKNEAEELLSKCKISRAEKINGNYCFKITGPNGNYIYLPLSDLRYDDGIFIRRGEKCASATVWTGNISDGRRYGHEHEQLAYALKMSETDASGLWTDKVICELDEGVRWYGRPVRAVMDK
jgi:hypothetical protein